MRLNKGFRCVSIRGTSLRVILLKRFGHLISLFVLHLLPHIGCIPPKNDSVCTCYGNNSRKY